jgi:hypothetical protein
LIVGVTFLVNLCTLKTLRIFMMEIRENTVRVEQPRFVLKAVLVCEDDDPGFAVDQDAITQWANEHATVLSVEPYDNICRIMATQFPRVVTVEVTDPETGAGVIIHPWTGA